MKIHINIDGESAPYAFNGLTEALKWVNDPLRQASKYTSAFLHEEGSNYGIAISWGVKHAPSYAQLLWEQELREHGVSL